ncbi:MAG: TlpA family protein disulfide reductase [Achromobacter sp.]|uniref:TlpA family protein disulfide reductase n=1 Tax=Achromobacter sp. TaxID=134375 RepID=UPI0012BF96B8|nr:TlpA disulfide reductase family protein [Achromobacter sp.]MPS82445.1 TlpA family protein disulfide reductase [Achromobacter sp.]
MNGMLQIGPVMLPVTLLAIITSVLAGQWISAWLFRRCGRDGQLPLSRLLLAGLLASRATFVAEQFNTYATDPASIIDIRDGGWNATAGFVAAWAYGGWLAWRRHDWKVPLLVGLAASTLVWSGAHLLAAASGSTMARSGLPAVEFRTLASEPQSLQDFRGRPVVINLWAGWCPPCRREMPIFAQAQEEYPDIAFVFLNQGESLATVKQFLAQQDLALNNVLLDADTQAATIFGHRALPATLFFDSDGRHVDTRLGELSRATLTQRLTLLNRPSIHDASKEKRP